MSFEYSKYFGETRIPVRGSALRLHDWRATLFQRASAPKVLEYSKLMSPIRLAKQRRGSWRQNSRKCLHWLNLMTIVLVCSFVKGRVSEQFKGSTLELNRDLGVALRHPLGGP